MAVLGLAFAGCSDPEILGTRSGLVDGAPTAGAHPWLESSVLSLRHTSGLYACTAVLVSDRVALTAYHCTIDNLGTWFVGDEEASLVEPAAMTLAVGESWEGSCMLEVEAIRRHPEAAPFPSMYLIYDDLAVLVLKESALETCPDVVPAPRIDRPLGVEDEGTMLHVAGFGYRDEDATLIGRRRWGEIELVFSEPSHLFIEARDRGTTAHGDSGGPAFVRTEEGGLTLVGLLSTSVPPRAAALNLYFQQTFLESVAPELDQCPGGSERWAACRGNVAVACASGIVTMNECAESERCNLDGEAASCAPEVTEPPLPDAAPAADAGPAPTTDSSARGCTISGPGARSTTGWWVSLLVGLVLVGLRAGSRTHREGGCLGTRRRRAPGSRQARPRTRHPRRRTPGPARAEE